MRPLYALVVLLGLTFLAAPASAGAAAVGSSPAAASPHCWGSVCDVLNQVCQRLGGHNCVGLDEQSRGTSGCLGAVCDAINRICHCLGLAAEKPSPASQTRCNGEVCDAVDWACKHYKPGWDCVASDDGNGSDPALRCAISACQDVDRICARWGAHCVG